MSIQRSERKGAWAGLGLIVLWCVLAQEAAGRTWHLRPDGSGEAPTIQAACDSAARGDTLLLECGSYTMSRELPPRGVIVEPRRAVILRSVTGSPDCVTIDCERGGGGVYFSRRDSLDAVTVIEGIRFTRGLTFAGGGGSALLVGNRSRVLVRDCEFVANEAGWPLGAGDGGAILCGGGSWVRFERCEFADNSSGDEGTGGAAFLAADADVEFLDCVFSDNSSRMGGAVYVCCPTYFEPRTTRFIGCRFSQNTAVSRGGAIAGKHSRIVLEGCWFDRNESPGGGALCLRPASLSATRCTVAGNRGSQLGAVLRCEEGSELTIDRCIAAYNSGGPVVVCEGSASAEVICSNIFDNEGGDWVGCLAEQGETAGNFSADPLFCDATGSDYTLGASSPCLPGQHPRGDDCGLIGAFDVGCTGPTAVTPTTWTRLRTRFR